MATIEKFFRNLKNTSRLYLKTVKFKKTELKFEFQKLKNPRMVTIEKFFRNLKNTNQYIPKH